MFRGTPARSLRSGHKTETTGDDTIDLYRLVCIFSKRRSNCGGLWGLVQARDQTNAGRIEVQKNLSKKHDFRSCCFMSMIEKEVMQRGRPKGQSIAKWSDLGRKLENDAN